MTYFEASAAVASLTMLVSKSKLFIPIRNKLPDWTPIHCPVCLSFWVASPALYWGPIEYLATVTFSNLWMLGIAKLYLAIDDMDYETTTTDE